MTAMYAPGADDTLSGKRGPAEEGRPNPLEIILAGRRGAGCQGTAHLHGTEQRTADAGLADFLCIRISGETYGIDIMGIREVIKPRRVTEIPWSPSHIAGVISLRGTMVPVLGMAKRLGVAAVPPTGTERVVVVRSAIGPVGLEVDQVGQVVRIARDSIQPPQPAAEGEDRWLVGSFCRDGQRIALLNLERVTDLGEGIPGPAPDRSP